MITAVKKLLYYSKRPFTFLRAVFGTYKPRFTAMDYNQYWKNRGAFGISTRYWVFADVIDAGSSVLDIGCGDGSTLQYLKEKKNIAGYGLDISQEAVEMAKQKGIKAAVADITRLEFNIEKKFDYIILSEVIEHVPNSEEVLQKTKGKFNKLLIVSIPNTGHYLHRLRLLFGRFPVQWVYHPGEHLRFWTVKDFKQWSKELGFEIVKIRVHSGIPILRQIVPALFADSIIYLLREAVVRQ